MSAATCSSMAMASPVRPADWYEAARLPRAVEGVGVVGAKEPLAVGGDPLLEWRWPRRCAPPTGTRAARLPRAVRVSGWSGPRSALAVGGDLLFMAMASPVRPADCVREARLPRAMRVSGWSGPRSRSIVGGDPLVRW